MAKILRAASEPRIYDYKNPRANDYATISAICEHYKIRVERIREAIRGGRLKSQFATNGSRIVKIADFHKWLASRKCEFSTAAALKEKADFAKMHGLRFVGTREIRKAKSEFKFQNGDYVCAAPAAIITRNAYSFFQKEIAPLLPFIEIAGVKYYAFADLRIFKNAPKSANLREFAREAFGERMAQKENESIPRSTANGECTRRFASGNANALYYRILYNLPLSPFEFAVDDSLNIATALKILYGGSPPPQNSENFKQAHAAIQRIAAKNGGKISGAAMREIARAVQIKKDLQAAARANLNAIAAAKECHFG